MKQYTSSQIFAADAASLSGRPKWEVEANAFATELLMPSTTFTADARKVRTLEIEAILRLAEKYKVSKLACARRIVGLGHEHCAVVLSHYNKVEGIYRSKEFPYIYLQKGMELPAKCLTRTFAGQNDALSELDCTEASYWTNREQGSSSFFEQVLVQANGWRMTLLICEDDEESEEGYD